MLSGFPIVETLQAWLRYSDYFGEQFNTDPDNRIEHTLRSIKTTNQLISPRKSTKTIYED
jgi:hypothetical protein